MSIKTELYLHDLGELIKEKAKEAKINENKAANKKDKDFQSGTLMAYYEVVCLMQDQAKVFGLSLEEIGLDNINPDKDLL